eukprot:COSAG02_NODE_18580_length_931_cov_1.207933_1_plen_86_part_00
MKAARAVALAVLLAASVGCRAERDLSLKLNKISQATSPKAKCIDGTPPAYAPTPERAFLSDKDEFSCWNPVLCPAAAPGPGPAGQ